MVMAQALGIGARHRAPGRLGMMGRQIWDALRDDKPALVGLAFIILLVAIAVVTAIWPGVLPYDPYEQDLAQSFQPPSPAHWFGTDQQGRDILCRILVGTQISLSVAAVVVVVSLAAGVLLGAIAGFKGGAVDTVIMRVMDMMLAIPSMLLAIALMAALGTGIDKAVIAISIVAIPQYARIVRGQVLSVKEREYISAARVAGDTDATIIFKHVLPNVMPSIIVRATLGVSSAILDTASLGFLGLGVQPPAAEWGDMLGSGRNFIFTAPYSLVFPGLAITVTVLAFNLLGDAIRDAFDPKSRKR
ncbi:nickel transporter permease [Enorma massiliensis]|uniref:nickel transporter permease n=1 Tax=Enorma massiliensis TaxID=1472761 RepID=UPI0002D7C82D|nr:nickel transporter permease [Enorma massiliensis]